MAWIFIVVSGFSVIVGVLQSIMVGTVFSVEHLQAAPNVQRDVLPFAEFMFENVRVLVFGFLTLSVTTFVSAIALLKRKNWGRLLFVCVMCFGITWNAIGIVMMFSSMPELPPNAPAEARAQMQAMAYFIKTFSLVMAVGLSILFGWIIKRLLSPTIRRECTGVL
jgi:hypothetical protein